MKCSTPEGIETVIRRVRRRVRSRLELVLNARRHRDGDQLGVPCRLRQDSPGAQRPKASDGDQTTISAGSNVLNKCSTPEGIETVIRYASHPARSK